MSFSYVQLNRSDTGIPWGFKLQGGTDLGLPLTIHSVIPGGLAERAGLNPGDFLKEINASPTANMRHDDAKMEIIRSMNSMTFTVFRQAPAQQQQFPAVTQPAAPAAPGPKYYDGYTPVSSTTKVYQSSSESHSFGGQPSTGRSSETFEVIQQTPEGRTKKVFHAQYNSPLSLYSNSAVQEAFVGQVQDPDAGPGAPALGQQQPFGGPVQKKKQNADPATLGLETMHCIVCGEYVKGVFVRVREKLPVHPDCLKCAKCGVGLRNRGYFYINDKLFCETHAKQVARPPEGMQAVTVFK